MQVRKLRSGAAHVEGVVEREGHFWVARECLSESWTVLCCLECFDLSQPEVELHRRVRDGKGKRERGSSSQAADRTPRHAADVVRPSAEVIEVIATLLQEI